MSYSSYTYNSPHIIQRLSHRRRFAKTLELVKKYSGRIQADGRFLDYGCADGYLASIVRKEIPGLRTVCYDPFPDANPADGVEIFSSLDGAVKEQKPYDLIGCFEVLEHLSPGGQSLAIKTMRELIADDGYLLISVPVECGLAGVFKAIFRKIFSRNLSRQYSLRNIYRTLFGLPLPEFRNREGYLNHIGFYFKDLKSIIEKYFRPEDISYSPTSFGGEALNSQIIAVYKPK